MNVDKEFVSLLASPEHVLPALEVIRAGDHLQQFLLRKFWNQVEQSLRAQIGNVPVVFKPRDSDREYDGVNGWLPDLNVYDQQLFCAVEHMMWKDGRRMDLYFGLHWRYPVDARAPEMSLKAVQELEHEQRVQQFVFDNNSWWLGWRYLEPKQPNTTDFLINLQTDADQTVERIVDEVVPWIAARYELIERANNAVRKTPRKT